MWLKDACGKRAEAGGRGGGEALGRRREEEGGGGGGGGGGGCEETIERVMNETFLSAVMMMSLARARVYAREDFTCEIGGAWVRAWGFFSLRPLM